MFPGIKIIVWSNIFLIIYEEQILYFGLIWIFNKKNPDVTIVHKSVIINNILDFIMKSK